MKRKFICVLTLIAMTASLFAGCKGKNADKSPNEVAHSVMPLCMWPLRKGILKTRVKVIW